MPWLKVCWSGERHRTRQFWTCPSTSRGSVASALLSWVVLISIFLVGEDASLNTSAGSGGIVQKIG